MTTSAPAPSLPIPGRGLQRVIGLLGLAAAAAAVLLPLGQLADYWRFTGAGIGTLLAEAAPWSVAAVLLLGVPALFALLGKQWATLWTGLAVPGVVLVQNLLVFTSHRLFRLPEFLDPLYQRANLLGQGTWWMFARGSHEIGLGFSPTLLEIVTYFCLAVYVAAMVGLTFLWWSAAQKPARPRPQSQPTPGGWGVPPGAPAPVPAPGHAAGWGAPQGPPAAGQTASPAAGWGAPPVPSGQPAPPVAPPAPAAPAAGSQQTRPAGQAAPAWSTQVPVGRYEVAVMGQRHGPYDAAQVRELVAAGRLTPDTLLSFNGGQPFPAREVPGLFRA